MTKRNKKKKKALKELPEQKKFDEVVSQLLSVNPWEGKEELDKLVEQEKEATKEEDKDNS